MIKVVEVSSDSNIGGAGKCIITFLKYFDRSRFDVSVVLPENSLLLPEIKQLGIKTYELGRLAEKSLDAGAIWSLRRLLRQIKPDIVHTHASMSARIAAKLCGIKTVYTRHSVFEPSRRLSQGVGRCINGFVNNHTADRIIAVAEAAKYNLTATGIREDKIDVILNGVEALTPLENRDEIRRSFGIEPNEAAVAIIARVTAVKGHEYFVKAAKILKDRGIRAKFLIAGTGDEEENVRRQISELELEDTVKMLGFLSDVEPLMNAMDIQANCSYGTEATSLSLLQGMSLGKPAVVTEFGGNPGVIQNGANGFLTPIKDAEAMADALERLITDDMLYERISRTSREMYNESFTAEANTSAIEKVYLELMSGK
ncbi:MAG TPA: glycosyltransferase [Candidatus Monoglobus merdigallinarum]|uniref:Glycosyltransferase n=1 Tax=Candidatus Monoglobus merdigallinarum TaxID=2838698 RepID=A0A9D1PPR0_9FIRM|nr:glycosyltransferase [Candidatus Monoglobus merdigallinarum]